MAIKTRSRKYHRVFLPQIHALRVENTRCVSLFISREILPPGACPMSTVLVSRGVVYRGSGVTALNYNCETYILLGQAVPRFGVADHRLRLPAPFSLQEDITLHHIHGGTSFGSPLSLYSYLSQHLVQIPQTTTTSHQRKSKASSHGYVVTLLRISSSLGLLRRK